MAEYFATPNETIDLGKNREWMELSDERGTLYGRGQASTPWTWASGARWEAGGATDGTCWRRCHTCRVSLPGKWAFSTKAEQLTYHLQNTQRTEERDQQHGGKRPSRSRPRMRRPDRRRPASCKSSPWLWTNAQDLSVTTRARCELRLGPDLNTWTIKRVFKTTGKIWIRSQC